MKTYSNDSLQETRVIRQLALEWVQGELPVDELTYVDCIKAITKLQKATGNLDRTAAIFDIVFKQASDLGKSSEWLANELQFESLTQTAGSRADLAMIYLVQTTVIDDDALDLYNERVSRFASTKLSPDKSRRF